MVSQIQLKARSPSCDPSPIKDDPRVQPPPTDFKFRNALPPGSAKTTFRLRTQAHGFMIKLTDAGMRTQYQSFHSHRLSFKWKKSGQWSIQIESILNRNLLVADNDDPAECPVKLPDGIKDTKAKKPARLNLKPSWMRWLKPGKMPTASMKLKIRHLRTATRCFHSSRKSGFSDPLREDGN